MRQFRKLSTMNFQKSTYILCISASAIFYVDIHTFGDVLKDQLSKKLSDKKQYVISTLSMTRIENEVGKHI